MMTQPFVKKEPPEGDMMSSPGPIYSTEFDALREVNQQLWEENQELRDQLILIQLPERIMTTQSVSAQLTGFRGVEVCGETTVVVTSDPQSFAWEGYGLKIYIPKGCLPAGVEQCTINIKASLAGQYKFPENSHPVSAVFWFHCEEKFTKKITLEINHCAESAECSNLTFVRAVRSQKQLPYIFSVLGGDFTGHSSYGTIKLKTFCGIGAVDQGPVNRRYCCYILYKEIKAATARYVVEIYFIVLWDTEAHNNAILKHFPGTKLAFLLPIRFKSEELELKIQNNVVAWNVMSVFPPVVLKEDVDSFKVDRRIIPHCHLKAKFTGDLANIPDLECHVDILGAREPHNKFIIDISPMLEASDPSPPPTVPSSSFPSTKRMVHTSQAEEFIHGGNRKRSREQDSGDFLKPELAGPFPKKHHIESHRVEGITLEEVAFQAGIELDLLSKKSTETVLLDVAKLCVDWQLIGKYLKLTDAEITAVDGSNRTVEEKRIAMLQKWRDKLAFKATYRKLVEALLAAGKASCAVEVAKIIGTGNGPLSPANKEYIKKRDDKPTLKYLMKELHPKVSDMWDDVGIELEVDDRLLVQIRKDYPRDSKQCLKEVLREWLQANNPPPSWEAIVQVMGDVGEDELATHLRSKYCN